MTKNPASLAERLMRPNVKKLTPYQSARGTVLGSDDLLFMDAAENPWAPFEGSNLNRYPAPQPADLLSALGKLYGVGTDQILATRGSEEAIRLLLQAFCSPGRDKILTCPPTFAMYTSEAAVHDVENVRVPRLGEFHDTIDMEAVMRTIDRTPAIKMIFLCNPGNPSSIVLPAAQIETLLKETRDRCLVAVDEAYIEFADHESFTTKLASHPNLVILRTLSKSYGLAGLRCGCAVASPEIIACLKRIIAPYPLPVPTIEIALCALQPEALMRMQEKQEILKQEREFLKSALQSCTLIRKIYPGKANFLCLVVRDAEACVRYFKDNGVIIRNRSAAIPESVNIAVGMRGQNEKTIALFKTLEQKT
jgi:histidinol-phosphate aminotransferase